MKDHKIDVFGSDWFGKAAESFARFFGTPQFIIGQTIIVAVWIVFNSLAITQTLHFDAMPFILLNLAFSTQAAYAAPLILLAQTRQAYRDKVWSDEDALHREKLTERQIAMQQQLLDLTSAQKIILDLLVQNQTKELEEQELMYKEESEIYHEEQEIHQILLEEDQILRELWKKRLE